MSEAEGSRRRRVGVLASIVVICLLLLELLGVFGSKVEPEIQTTTEPGQQVVPSPLAGGLRRGQRDETRGPGGASSEREGTTESSGRVLRGRFIDARTGLAVLPDRATLSVNGAERILDVGLDGRFSVGPLSGEERLVVEAELRDYLPVHESGTGNASGRVLGFPADGSVVDVPLAPLLAVVFVLRNRTNLSNDALRTVLDGGGSSAAAVPPMSSEAMLFRRKMELKERFGEDSGCFIFVGPVFESGKPVTGGIGFWIAGGERRTVSAEMVPIADLRLGHGVELVDVHGSFPTRQLLIETPMDLQITFGEQVLAGGVFEAGSHTLELPVGTYTLQPAGALLIDPEDGFTEQFELRADRRYRYEPDAEYGVLVIEKDPVWNEGVLVISGPNSLAIYLPSEFPRRLMAEPGRYHLSLRQTQAGAQEPEEIGEIRCVVEADRTTTVLAARGAKRDPIVQPSR